MTTIAQPSTNKVITALFAKSGDYAEVSDSPSYELLNKNTRALVDSGTLTLSGSGARAGYPYTFNQGSGDYDLIVRTTDVAADYQVWSEEITVAVAPLDSSGVTTLLSRLSSARALALDYLDASILSRSSHTATDVWGVGTRTLTGFGTLIADIWAYASRTLSTISDSGGVTTLLSRLTSTRAGYLDNLDAAITTRLSGDAYTAPDNAGISAIQDKTDQLVFTTANRVDASALNDVDIDAATITAIQSGLATEALLAEAQAVLEKLDTALELDGLVYRFTANAFDNIPAATVDADLVGDAILQAQVSDHITVEGSIANYISAIKAKTDALVIKSIRYMNAFDPLTQTLKLVRGNTKTILFENLKESWTGATSIKLGIRRAGQRDAAPLLEIAGAVVNASTISITLPANFGIDPELESGDGLYEWDLTGKLLTGEVVTIASISPLIVKDRIARVS